ncbi:hypothetical protein RJT34_19720 [Clitoria ternatea]|uniref:Callose synthase helical domain-containing protein n=1 Tax=Clitoria ternatea TaxID=43366 RepID=A0AAN9IRT6_CLITE
MYLLKHNPKLDDSWWAVDRIFAKVEDCIKKEQFVKQSEEAKLEAQIINALLDIVEVIIQDVMVDGHLFLAQIQRPNKEKGKGIFNIDHYFELNDKSVMDKVNRLHVLLTTKESGMNVPQNLDAWRRIAFFVNSLFMKIPKAPNVRDMLSFRFTLRCVEIQFYIRRIKIATSKLLVMWSSVLE